MPVLRSLTRGAALLIGASILGLALPQAQGSEGGVIKGRVVNGATGDPQSGVRVSLTGADDTGSNPVQRTIRTDTSGRYRFGGLDTNEEMAYAVDAEYQGGLFAGRPVRFPEEAEGQPVIDSILRVWETTTDPAAVVVTRDDMFAVLGAQGIAIIEAVTIVNQTQMAYIGRGGSETSGDPSPSFGFSLPVDCEAAGVTIVDADIDVPQILCTDFGFGITSSIPPGEMRTTFSYRVPGSSSTFDLSRTALYDVSELSVFAAEPLTIESNRLVEKGEVTLAGEKYREFSSKDPARPGDSIQVVAIAEAGLSGGLVVGIAASLAFLALLAWLTFRRARRSVRTTPPAPGPDGSVTAGAIARLDVDYRNGELTHDEWLAMRDELKQRLSKETGIHD
jgi:hypothetical protein